MRENAVDGAPPLSGMREISRSRSFPRPPRLMDPAETPPSGNAIILRWRPLKRRIWDIGAAHCLDGRASGAPAEP
jgi:hypothetical protein